MVRGSAWVLIKGYITYKNGRININSYENVYGYSAVGDANTQYQRQILYERALNKALATYREHHDLPSDYEMNYHLVNSGIQYNNKGQRTKWGRIRITPNMKRQSHRIVIGRDKYTPRDYLKRQIKDDNNKISENQKKEVSRRSYTSRKHAVRSRGRHKRR